MKKALLLIFFAATLCSPLRPEEEAIEATQAQNSCYVFDFVVKGSSNSKAWRKILEVTAKHVMNFQKKLERNPLSKKQTPIDDTVNLMSTVQRLAMTDQALSVSLSHQSIQDPAINPEELDPNTLIVRFFVTTANTYTDEHAPIMRMSQKTLREFVDALEHAESFTFEDLKNYFKQLDTISHFNEQDDHNPVQVGLSLWVKKDNPNEQK